MFVRRKKETRGGGGREEYSFWLKFNLTEIEADNRVGGKI